MSQESLKIDEIECLVSSVVGPKVLKKAQIKDRTIISSIGIQGKTNLELVFRNKSICSFIV